MADERDPRANGYRSDGLPGQTGNPDNELTLPNIFGGVPSRDEDPDRIVENLTARALGTPLTENPPTTSTPTPQQPFSTVAPGQAPPGYWAGERAAPTQGARSEISYRTEYNASPQYVGGAPAATVAPDQDKVHRRRATIGVLSVVAATIAVVSTAIIVAPNWSGSSTPDPAPAPTSIAQSPATSTLPAPTTASQSAVVISSGSAPASATGSSRASGITTVTVTAPAKTAPGSAASKSSASIATPVKTTPVKSTPPKTTPPKTTPPKTTPVKTTPPKTTPPKTTPPKTTPAVDMSLGAPRQDIRCTNGFVVQLASELTPAAFKARVAVLRAQGMVPDGAKAADSRSSCRIFANQRNTYVLYAGPFADPYQGCDARIGGPADAFIKGANPSTSRAFISCVCGRSIGALPRLTPQSADRGWTGELQRFLAGQLNISVGDLGSGQWGVYNAATQTAVKSFQQQHRLRQTGAVDGGTWKMLKRVGC